MFDPRVPLPASVVATIRSVKSAREAVIRSVESGDADFVSAVATTRGNDVSGSLYVLKLLEVVPGLGKVRSRRALDAIGRDYFVRLCDLTDDEVGRLNQSERESF